jgi:hypothetical protein
MCLAVLLSCGFLAEVANVERSHAAAQSSLFLAASLLPSNVSSATAATRQSWISQRVKHTTLPALIDTLSLPMGAFSRAHVIQSQIAHQWRPGDARVISDRAPPGFIPRF